jgi:hypothetical protein
MRNCVGWEPTSTGIPDTSAPAWHYPIISLMQDNAECQRWGDKVAFADTILASEAVAELGDAFTLPVVNLVPGFYAAFVIATVLCIIAVAFSYKARDLDQATQSHL